METVARRLVHLVRSSGGETEGATKAEMLYATSGMCTALASGGRDPDVSRAPAPGSDRHLCKAYHSNRHPLYQTQHYEPPAVHDTVATDLSPVDWLARTPIPDTGVAIGSGCPSGSTVQLIINNHSTRARNICTLGLTLSGRIKQQTILPFTFSMAHLRRIRRLTISQIIDL